MSPPKQSPKRIPRRERSTIDLPHGASLDLGSSTLQIPLGDNVISLPAIQLETLIELLDDIQTVLDSQSVMSSVECPTCGTLTQSIDYVSPDDGDGYN
jgi:hypothetical protein